MSEVKKAIEKANLRFAEAVKKGDAKALADLYTEDAVLLPAGTGAVKGKKSVEEFWGGAIKGMGLKGATLKTVEVVGMGDDAAEMGEYVLKLQSGGKSMEDVGKYVVLWKKTPDGWKLHWDIWTTSIQPK